MNGSDDRLIAEPGSFRDRGSKVYYSGNMVVRGVSKDVLSDWKKLSEESYFQAMLNRSDVVSTSLLDGDVLPAKDVIKEGWAGVLQHARVPFVTYPYEWTFGMLKDAALFHLKLLERAIEAGWILKDASAYNVQWLGVKPTFIDIASFEPRLENEPWIGYRQFCMMFLVPLLMKAHRDIDYIPFLRSNLDGIDPVEAIKFFPRLSYLKKGVFVHIFLHSKMQKRYSDDKPGEADAPDKTINHSKAMVLGTIQGLARLVKNLRLKNEATTWGDYDQNHSYDDESFLLKQDFVSKHAEKRHWPLVWDMGCNTGRFSRLCSPYAGSVISIDGDHLAIERLYQQQKKEGSGNILPLIINLNNLSPNQGWQGRERMALEARGTPDLLLCLALIHHIVISSNIPMREFVEWLRGLSTCVIIEFVGLEDEMARHLLKNKVNQYSDYTRDNFEGIVNEMFTVVDSLSLKSGVRKIYYLEPKG